MHYSYATTTQTLNFAVLALNGGTSRWNVGETNHLGSSQSERSIEIHGAVQCTVSEYAAMGYWGEPCIEI